ncbi:hypothetical protein MMPV_002104 [Pyropia vietnamensis]
MAAAAFLGPVTVARPLGARPSVGDGGVDLAAGRAATARRRVVTGAPRRAAAPRWTAAADRFGGGGSGDGGDGGGDSLGKSIAKVLEVSYRKVWLRLMTIGTGEEYERAIQEFIIGAVSAYKSGYSLAALALELKQNEVRTGDDALDASLRLSDREEATRRVWLLLIYLTLAAKGFEPSPGVNPASLLSGAETAATGLEALSDAKDDDKSDAATATDNADNADAPATSPARPLDGAAAVERFRDLVADVTAAAAKGYTLDSLKLEQSLALRDGEQGLGAAEASVRSQFMRIIFLTARMVAPKRA